MSCACVIWEVRLSTNNKTNTFQHWFFVGLRILEEMRDFLLQESCNWRLSGTVVASLRSVRWRKDALANVWEELIVTCIGKVDLKMKTDLCWDASPVALCVLVRGSDVAEQGRRRKSLGSSSVNRLFMGMVRLFCPRFSVLSSTLSSQHLLWLLARLCCPAGELWFTVPLWSWAFPLSPALLAAFAEHSW